MKKQLPYNLSFVCVLIFVVLPTLVRGECTCDEEDGDRNKAEALKYKIGAIVSILVAGAIGVFLPLLGKVFPALSPEKNVFFIIKAFAAGVILSTGFIHVLPDAFESLTSPCLNNHPWGKFPFTGFVAMVTAIGTLMIDAFSMSYYKRSNMRKMTQSPAVAVGQKDEEQATGQLNLHTHASHGHAHGSSALVSDDSGAELLRHRVVTQVLELGILVHSVIIGISLGASESPKTVRPLVAALTFHQFFEGLGLGGCITQAKFKARAITVMGLFFALTVPVGIGIGIWITKGYDENSPTALIVEGVLNAASAGILIYMALVDLLAADFMSPKMQSSLKLQVSANASLLIGAGLMSLLAKWA